MYAVDANEHFMVRLCPWYFFLFLLPLEVEFVARQLGGMKYQLKSIMRVDIVMFHWNFLIMLLEFNCK